MELAATQSARLLTSQQITLDNWLCAALRGEQATWSLLPDDITAQQVVERSQHHGIEALLFHAVRSLNAWQTWPDTVRNQLELSSKAGIAHDLLRRERLDRLLQSLSRHGVRCVLTKGEALAATHYPIPGTRTRGDSDLFISLQQIEQAREAITAAGFIVELPVYKRHQFTVREQMGSSGAVVFDVHWRILNAARFARALTFDQVYASASKASQLHGARLISAPHALLVACMHRCGSQRHDPNRLIWIHDLHVLLSSMSRQQLDAFCAVSTECGVSDIVLDGLAVCMQRFGTAVPHWLLQALAEAERVAPARSRFQTSQLKLLMDDFAQLPAGKSRRGLVRDLFTPPQDSLLRRYGKTHAVWLPFLYCRQIVGGIVSRMMLR